MRQNFAAASRPCVGVDWPQHRSKANIVVPRTFPLLQVTAEELARDVEDATPLDPLHFRAAARVLAHLHLKRSRGLVQIGAIEEGMGQSFDQSERHVVSLALQGVLYRSRLWPCGTELSDKPCMMRNGGASFPT